MKFNPKNSYSNYLTHTALSAGIPFAEIRNMSTDEIALTSQVKQEQNEELAQLLAWIAYNTAALIAVAVNDPKKFPTLEEAFPSLFKQKGQQQQDWRIMKERMETFAKAKKQVNYEVINS